MLLWRVTGTLTGFQTLGTVWAWGAPAISGHQRAGIFEGTTEKSNHYFIDQKH
jgi:hypothetical protein